MRFVIYLTQGTSCPGSQQELLLRNFCWPSLHISPLLSCLTQTPGTETTYPRLEERFSGVQLMLFSALPEDLRPSLFCRFGVLGQVHVCDENLQLLLSNVYWKWAVAIPESEGWHRTIPQRERGAAGESK